MSEHKKDFPEFYVTAPHPCPYLPERYERKLFTHLTRDKSDFVIDNLLTGGFRRSQNIAYIPYCDACNACISVRIDVENFCMTSSMKRIANKNKDLDAFRVPAQPTAEQYALFRAYLDERHAEGGMADMTVLDYAMMVEDSVVNTFITEYRLHSPLQLPGIERRPASGQTRDDDTPLIAVALCDRLSDGLSLVYSFFEPAMTSRSLGTHIIAEHVSYAKSEGLPYVYLGYWIQHSQKMAYKKRFQPLQYLTSSGWANECPD